MVIADDKLDAAKMMKEMALKGSHSRLTHAGIRGGGGPDDTPPPPWNFVKNVVIGFVSGIGFILNSIYVQYNIE